MTLHKFANIKTYHPMNTRYTIYISLVFSAFLSLNATAQSFGWEASGGTVGTTNSFSGAMDLARDNAGNLFLFNDGNTAQQCQGDTVQPLGGPGSSNTYVHKFDPAGTLQWIRPVGSQFQPFSIRCDDSGNAYLLGRTLTNTIFLSDTTVSVIAFRNYLLKLSPDGDLVWLHDTGMPFTGGVSRTTLLHYAAGKMYFQSGDLSMACIDTAGADVGTLAASSYAQQTAFPNLWFKSAVSLSNGDVVIAGEHRGELAFPGYPSQPGNATSSALNRYFFLRCDDSLNVIQWYSSHGSFLDRFQHNIPLVVDPLDNVYASVTLNFNTPIVFGPDVLTNSTFGNGIDAIIKMDGAGEPLWMRSIQATGSTYAYGLVWKDDDSGLLACGEQISSATFGTSVIQAFTSGRGFIAEIDPDGNFLRGFPSGVQGQAPTSLQSFSYALASDGTGNYFVAGRLSTLGPWELSCTSRIQNLGFFLATFTGAPDEVPEPQIVQVENTLIAEPVFNGSIQWLFNGEPIPNAIDQSYVPTENGSYSVIFTNETGCTGSDTSSVTQVITTGLLPTDGRSSEGLLAWPNPTDGTVLLSGLGNGGPVRITITDAIGRTWMDVGAHAPGTPLDLHALPSGVYWLCTENSDGVKALRIVRQ